MGNRLPKYPGLWQYPVVFPFAICTGILVLREKTITTAHKAFALVLIFLLAFPAPLFAWDSLGHMAVAYVAYQHLNPATKTRVNKLLRLNPDYHKWLTQIPQGTSAANKMMMIFMMAATWPDQIRSEPGYTDDGTQGGNRPDGATSVQNIGYTDHLHHKYWHFVDTPFSTDGTTLPPLPTPNAGTQIGTFRAVLASNDPDEKKSYDLVWLEHLVGDVHQPLHAATRVSHTDPNGDNGGNNVKLCAPPCRDELHAFWDDILGTGSSPSTAVSVGRALPDADSTLAAKKDAADWIKESFDAAQQNVYVAPIGDGDGPFTITPAYRTAAKKLAKERVALAGVRLANLLNDELK
jgi:S1/P1 Nuclease